MPKHVTSAERYRQLAEECLDVAQNFPLGTARDTLLQMAQVWQRLGGHVPRSRRRHLALGVGQRSPALSPTWTSARSARPGCNSSATVGSPIQPCVIKERNGNNSQPFQMFPSGTKQMLARFADGWRYPRHPDWRRR